MLPLLAAFLLASPQDLEPAPASPFDRVVELELTAADDPLIDGRGPTVVAEYQAEFEGTLHVWTRSELDLFLRVERIPDGTVIDEDDDSGGGRTPYVELAARRGDFIAVLVASPSEEEVGKVDLCLAASPETDTTRAAAKAANEARTEVERLRSEGGLQAARQFLARALDSLQATPGSQHSARVSKASWDLGFTASALSDVPATLAAWSRTHQHRSRTRPEDHPDLLWAKGNLANSLDAVGDLAGARALREAVLAGRERTLPGDHPDLLLAQNNLALSLSAMGDLVGARALQEAVLAGRERTLPGDHPDLLLAQNNLAVSLHAMGDLAGARAFREAVLAGRERTLPEDHPHLLGSRHDLAISLSAMGDLVGARALQEAVLAGYERTLPEDHPDLLLARNNLALSLSAMGDLAGARALQEAVLAGYERTLPEDHPGLLMARGNLARSMYVMGDLAGARALQEAVLAGRERTLPEDHPDLLLARGNLAVSLSAMGDLAGARALQEAVLAGYERTLPEDHPHLLHARSNLAISLSAMGDLAGARVVREAVLAGRERTLPEDHPDLLSARNNLALSLSAMGDLAGARALQEAALAGYERTLPEDHPGLLLAQNNLARSMYVMGDLAGARALQEAVLAGRERTLPEDHPDLLLARYNLANSLYAMGDLAGARALLPSLAGGMRARVLASLALAPRQALSTVADESHRLSAVLFLSDSGESPLQRVVFELTETLRLVGGEAARSLARFERDPELAPILAEAASVRSRLNDLVAGSARDASDLDVAEELTRLTLERDALESEASRKLAERGVVVRALDSEALAAALDAGEVAVGYRRVRHWEGGEPVGDRMIAHVLTSTGALARVDLGPANELEELASDWRAALGASLLRGVALTGEERSEPEAGRALRARLLDPVLAAVGGEVARLYVCADDLVFLVPLDALSLEDEAERVGDRWQIVSEVSFARLLSPGATPDAAPSLLALGGVDYDAVGSTPAGLSGSSAPIEEGDEVGAGSESATSRSAPTDHFQSLLQSRLEAEATGILFQDAFELDPVLLTKKGTTKAALFEAAPGTRYLHIATHGWFAPESVKSILDASPAYSLRMTLEERITGLAPMTLCGLALAGANRGRDSLGRVPGILTGEELCSLDLSQCDLAVLSACETNVGIRRAGQGIQSLQAALYAAGARTSITSLWKVDDAATRRLFEVFYTKLWKEKLGKADALWQAKMALRREGHPPRDWAGWVLTGDPD